MIYDEMEKVTKEQFVQFLKGKHCVVDTVRICVPEMQLFSDKTKNKVIGCWVSSYKGGNIDDPERFYIDRND